jgi:hypothetical protein
MRFVFDPGTARRGTCWQWGLFKLVLLSLERQEMVDPFHKEESKNGRELR